MSDIAYVDEASAELAREMESKLQRLPSEAGVLFVSVEPTPVAGGRVVYYTVRVGVDRKLEVSTGVSLVKQALDQEFSSGLYIGVAVYRGVAGGAKQYSLSRLGAPAA